MSTFAEPVVAWRGSTDSNAPLVVLLHGRGSNEAETIGLADHLTADAAYAAVRAPIAEGGGYARCSRGRPGEPRRGYVTTEHVSVSASARSSESSNASHGAPLIDRMACWWSEETKCSLHNSSTKRRATGRRDRLSRCHRPSS